MSFRYTPLHLQYISPTSNGCSRVDHRITWYRSPAAVSALHQNTDIETISNGILFTQALSTLKSDIFPTSDGQYRSLNGIVDNHETYNWTGFLFVDFYKCPLDEYVSVGSVDTYKWIRIGIHSLTLHANVMTRLTHRSWVTHVCVSDSDMGSEILKRL